MIEEEKRVVFGKKWGQTCWKDEWIGLDWIGWCDRRRQNRTQHVKKERKKENSTRESIINETSTLNPVLVG